MSQDLDDHDVNTWRDVDVVRNFTYRVCSVCRSFMTKHCNQIIDRGRFNLKRERKKRGKKKKKKEGKMRGDN